LKCEDYAALSELRNATAENCPDCGCGGHQTSDEHEDDDEGKQDDIRAKGRPHKRVKRERQQCDSCQCSCVGKLEQAGGNLPTPPSSPGDSDVVLIGPPRTPSISHAKASYLPTPSYTPSKCSNSASTPAYLLPPVSPYKTDFTLLSPIAPYACQRASPRICPNQCLVEALDVIRRSRNLEGEARSELHASHWCSQMLVVFFFHA
jgi:DNA polymerase IV